MEYNNNNYFEKKSSSNKYIKLTKKNNLQINTNANSSINSHENTHVNSQHDYLNQQIIELTNRIEFCKKYSKNFYNESNQNFLSNSINIIEQLILEFDKNIVEKGKFNRTSKLIELEF